VNDDLVIAIVDDDITSMSKISRCLTCKSVLPEGLDGYCNEACGLKAGRTSARLDGSRLTDGGGAAGADSRRMRPRRQRCR